MGLSHASTNHEQGTTVSQMGMHTLLPLNTYGAAFERLDVTGLI